MSSPVVRWLKLTLPRLATIAFVMIVAFAFCEGLTAWARWADPSNELARFIYRLRDVCCIGAAGILGVYRVAGFHPQLDSDYMSWLYLTPWQPHKPLPKGPLHLGWQDVLALGLLFLFSAHQRQLPAAHIPLAFSLGYGLTMAFSLVAIDQSWLAMATLALIGLVARLMQESQLAGLAAALFLVGPWSYGCVYVTLKTFPWTARATEFRRSMRRNWQVFTTGHKEHMNQGVNFDYPETEVQWPYNRLHARVRPLLSRPQRVAVAALVGWWLYVLFSLPYGDQGALVVLGTLYPISVLLATGSRLVLYSMHHWSPISLLGRIFTLRWIIPAYDVVFLTPLATIATGIAAPLTLNWLAIPPSLIVSLSVPAVLLVVTLGGPKMTKWQLTAPVRLHTGVRNQQLVEEI